MKKTILLIIAVCAMMLVAEKAQANDFLEIERHYSALTTGADKVHFKLPVYSRGNRDYYVSTNDQGSSYVFYTVGGQSYSIFTFGSEHNSDGPSAKDKTGYGRAWVSAYDDRGVVEITNIYDGQRKVVPSDGAQRAYNVKKEKESENDNDYVTWLEIDWYIPESLDQVEFNIDAHVNVSLRMTGNVNYTFDWTLATGLEGRTNMIQAQLFTPYFYAVNEYGATGFGNAAVPYSVFYDPIQYSTSQNPTDSIPTSERAGNLIVPTTDTIQKDFYATFKVYTFSAPLGIVECEVVRVSDNEVFDAMFYAVSGGSDSLYVSTNADDYEITLTCADGTIYYGEYSVE